MDLSSKIYVAGHRGLVGIALCRELHRQGFRNVIGKTRQELDLLDGTAVERFYAQAKPEYVFAAAAKVGGIGANSQYPADFLYENLQVQNNLIYSAFRAGVKKLLFLGSSCIYPKLAPQPLKEEYLLTAPLEPTNEWYAVADLVHNKTVMHPVPAHAGGRGALAVNVDASNRIVVVEVIPGQLAVGFRRPARPGRRPGAGNINRMIELAATGPANFGDFVAQNKQVVDPSRSPIFLAYSCYGSF